MKQKLLLISALFLLSSHLFAATGSDLELRDERYAKIDLLIAHGLIQHYVRGVRPWSEETLQKMLAEAEENFQQQKNHFPFVEAILQDLQRSTEHKNEKYSFLDTAEFEFIAHNDPERDISEDRSGRILARMKPLTAYRDGRSYVNGQTVHVSSSHWWQPEEHSFLYLKPRFSAFLSSNDNPKADANLEQGYAKFSAWNTELSLGRMQLALGQGRFGGTLMSNNARPFDMVRLKNLQPIRIPYLGELGLHFFLGTLGPEQSFPYTLLSGYKISWKPTKKIELGYAPVIQFGGEGAPSFDFLTGVHEWFSLPVGTQTGKQYVNRLIALDASVRFSSLRNAEIYGEATFDDKGFQHIKSTLINDVAYVLGIWIPRLSSNGTWQLRLEGKRLGPIMYRHSAFANGFTLNRNILGDALGSDSKGIFVGLTQWRNVNDRLHYFSALEAYQDDTYAASAPDHGRVISVNGPQEARWRTGAGYQHAGKNHMTYTFDAAYEYVHNFAFHVGENQHHAMGAVALRKNF